MESSSRNAGGALPVRSVFFSIAISVVCLFPFTSSSLPEKQCTWLYRENPKDCASYFQCLHGKPVLQRCPRSLYWNEEGSYCDWEFRTSCKKKKKGGSISKYAPSTSSVSKFEMLIKATQGCDGTYRPDPSDCSKYTMCSNGQISSHQCPAPLMWDQSLTICNWPQSTQCSSGTATDPAAPEPPAAAPAEEPAPAPAPASNPDSPPIFPPPAETAPAPAPAPQPVAGISSVSSTTTTTRPPTTVTTSKPPSSSNFKVICYYSNWAYYRSDYGKYSPAEIDPTLCTHIIYAFAIMNPTTYKLQMADTWLDGKDGLNHMGSVTAFRSHGVKTLIAVGGWVDSGSPKWSTMLADPNKMKTFIDSCYDFIEEHGFDGLDLDYEYPACPQCNCNLDSSFEKQAFIALIVGLRQKFGPNRLLSAAVSCNEAIVQQAYDVPTMSKYLDFLNLMTYDIHGSWEQRTGHNAPLGPQHSSDLKHLNVEYAVRKYIELLAPPEKICLGMPLYGQNFQLSNPNENTLLAKSAGPGPGGNFTKQGGMLSYYEICMMKDPVEVYDPSSRLPPYRYSGGQWVTYDNPDYITVKCDFIKELNLGGAMIWALDLDDFRGTKCNQGKYPLLTTINNNLRKSRKRVTKKKSLYRN